MLRRRRAGVIRSSLVDIALTLQFVLRLRRRFDLYIGAGQHLILLGLFLRRLRVVKKVVAFSMDYWPQKYRTRFLDRLYHTLDAYCVTRADWVFNASAAMFEARLRRGIKLDPARQITVPHPIEAHEIGSVPRDQLEPDSLIFAGLAGAEYGFELLIDAMALVLRRNPATTITVTGYGELSAHLREMIARRGLTGAFRLAGYISDAADFRHVLRRKRVGLAPYSPLETSCKRYTDVSRPKIYMANGVPPIITRVPPLAREIEAMGAGLVVDYDKEQLADAILRLLADDELHEHCRQRGFDLVKQYDAETICDNALGALGIISSKPAATAGLTLDSSR
jgi:glycosyltransferase involved in cell wall biosynthesis